MPNKHPPRLSVLGPVALIDLAIFVVAAVVSRLIGWRTLRQYCDTVVLGGMITISIGLWMLWQKWNLSRDFTSMHAQSMTDRDSQDRVKLLRRDDDTSYQSFVHLFISGLAAIVAGAVVQILFAP